MVEIGLDLLPDGPGNFDTDFLDPSFIFLQKSPLPRHVDGNPEAGAIGCR